MAAGCWPLCRLVSWPGVDLPERPVSPLRKDFSHCLYLGKFKGLNEALHSSIPWICYIRGERAPALHLHGWPLSVPPSTPAPMGLAALMGSQGTQESAPKGRAIDRLSTETLPMLGAQKSVCFEHKDNRSNIKNVNFQTEQEGLACFCDMCPPISSFRAWCWVVRRGRHGWPWMPARHLASIRSDRRGPPPLPLGSSLQLRAASCSQPWFHRPWATRTGKATEPSRATGGG